MGERALEPVQLAKPQYRTLLQWSLKTEKSRKIRPRRFINSVSIGQLGFPAGQNPSGLGGWAGRLTDTVTHCTPLLTHIPNPHAGEQAIEQAQASLMEALQVQAQPSTPAHAAVDIT